MGVETTAVTSSAAYLRALMEQRGEKVKPRGHVQPKKYATAADRQRAYRERRKAKP